MEPARKPPTPSTLAVIKRDNWALAGIVLPALFVFSSLLMFVLTSEEKRFAGFWPMINLLLYPPVIIAVPFLYWRVPRRVKHIRQIWQEGVFIIGKVITVQQGTRTMPNILHYSYSYDGETYQKAHMVGSFWNPRPSMELPLIIVPGKPDEVIITDLY